jgi:hypothetical protein
MSRTIGSVLHSTANEAPNKSNMKIGVLATGETAVRAAHSLSAHPGIDQVVVIGPARSKNFPVVESAEDCDFLLGVGPQAPAKALHHGVPLIWDGEDEAPGVTVWGASPRGLTLAMAAGEADPQLVALAHPALDAGTDRQIRFPDPIGAAEATDTTFSGQRLAVAKSATPFAACLVRSAGRNVTVVDDGRFMSGVTLAAGIALVGSDPTPVWGESYPYLMAATSMGLVMGEG